MKPPLEVDAMTSRGEKPSSRRDADLARALSLGSQNDRSAFLRLVAVSRVSVAALQQAFRDGRMEGSR